MKVTIYDIVSANSIFNKILKYEFTGKQSFVISRLLRVLNAELEQFNTTREILIKKYAEFDENGKIKTTDGYIKISENKKDAFQSEINELLQTEVELNITCIPIEWFDDIKLTPQEIMLLEPFLLIK